MALSVTGDTLEMRTCDSTALAAQDMLGALQPRVAASTGAACTSGISEPSHVLRALGLSSAQADSSIRFSFGRFTVYEEIRDTANLVLKFLEPPRRRGS